jgi:nitrous oxide reductase accessory protein NosL
MPDTEVLTADELAEITGYKHPGSQKEWLDANGWQYVLNAARRPIVGRWFARMRLAGVQPTANGGTAPAWKPDFSALAP